MAQYIEHDQVDVMWHGKWRVAEIEYYSAKTMLYRVRVLLDSGESRHVEVFPYRIRKAEIGIKPT